MFNPDIWKARMSEALQKPRIVPEDLVQIEGDHVALHFEQLDKDADVARSLFDAYATARGDNNTEVADLTRRHFGLLTGVSAPDLFEVIERRERDLANQKTASIQGAGTR